MCRCRWSRLGWDNVDTVNNTRGDKRQWPDCPLEQLCVLCGEGAARGPIGHPTHTWTAIVSADSAVMNLTTSEVTSHLEHTWPDRDQRPGPDHREYVAGGWRWRCQHNAVFVELETNAFTTHCPELVTAGYHLVTPAQP